MLKNWVIYILALVGAISFFLCYRMWFSWFILMVTVSILPLAIVVCFASFMFFKIESDSFRKVIKGEETRITFHSYGLDFFPFALYSVKVILTETMTGEESLIRLFSQGDTEDSVIIDTKHCGTYHFKSAKVRVYDMLGLVFLPKKVDLSGEIIVMPVPSIPQAVPELSGFKAKGLRSAANSNSEIYDVREYVPGDPIKKIHWKLSAKKNILMIKEAQEETFGHSRLFLPMIHDRDKMDRNLGELLFTSNYFLSHDVEHKIQVFPPMRKEISFVIASKDDLEKAIISIMRIPIPEVAEDE